MCRLLVSCAEFEAIPTPIRHKTQVSDPFEVGKLYFKIDSYLPDFREPAIFPYISLYTQAVAYTTYVESAARRALKNTSKRPLLSLESLCFICCIHMLTSGNHHLIYEYVRVLLGLINNLTNTGRKRELLIHGDYTQNYYIQNELTMISSPKA